MDGQHGNDEKNMASLLKKSRVKSRNFELMKYLLGSPTQQWNQNGSVLSDK